MEQPLWPRRPLPQVTGPLFERAVSELAQLRNVRAQLRAWVADSLADSLVAESDLDDLLVVVDELASNGLRHGRVPVRVCAVRTAQWLLLDVSDGDPQQGPEPAVGRDPALGGMGLRMVAHMTVDRGWAVTDGRKHVWACLPAR